MTTITTEDADLRSGFSAALRTATWAAHRDAQRSSFMDDLLGGKLDRSAYARLVAQHYFVYVALEGAVEAMRGDPEAAPFLDGSLTRVPALESDLGFLLGRDWASKIAPSAETAAYSARIADVCSAWPGGLIAHHYVRYMGDLSGGQHIGALVRKAYGLSGDGARFYAFDAIADPDAFKLAYREQLDRAPWAEAERARVIDEALVAYSLNTRVLNALS